MNKKHDSLVVILLLVLGLVMAQIMRCPGETYPAVAEIDSLFSATNTNLCMLQGPLRSLVLRMRLARSTVMPQYAHDAESNLFVRLCVLSVPTNDYHAFYRGINAKGLMMANDVVTFPSLTSDRGMLDCLALEIGMARAYPVSEITNKLAQARVMERDLAMTNRTAWLTNSIGYCAPLRDELARVESINADLMSYRRTLIRFYSKPVAAYLDSLSAVESATFTNRFTTTAGLTDKEVSVIFNHVNFKESGELLR